jgi:hypothetical protein
LALVTFCIGACFISTDAFTLSLQGFYFSLMDVVANVAFALFVEDAILQSGSDSVLFQESVSGFRVMFSVLVSACLVVVQPEESFDVQLDGFPLCLLVASSALDLAASVSMTSMIGSSSALTFLMVEQFSELMVIFIGQTLNPNRFTTFKEEIFSFLGFSLAIPGQILFLVIGNPRQRRPTDVEPFQVAASDDQGEPEVAGDDR